MKAAIFQGVGKIEAGEQPDPVIKEQTDAIVRVVLACVCGSDLWPYRGANPITQPSRNLLKSALSRSPSVAEYDTSK